MKMILYKFSFNTDYWGECTDYYVAEVPALLGCFSQGTTLEEAKENIKEAVEGWIEVMNDKVRKVLDEEVMEIVV
jgi:predicted RNase H-like HicB family nuclease